MNKRYYKEIDGNKVFYKGESIVLGQWRITNPSEKQLIEAGWMVYESPTPPEPMPEERLRDAIANKIIEIEEYDNSDAINGIIVNGVQLWIPAEQRAILKTSVDAYKTLGIDSITKVWEGQEYTATTDEWLYMIATVEVYASECYNATARHKAAVEALDNIEDVEEYDYTLNYPDMLEFNI